MTTTPQSHPHPWHGFPTRALLLSSYILLPPSLSAAQILSTKRGFADTGASYSNLQATNAGWYYTWGTGTGSPANFDANHYPMFWGGSPSTSSVNNILSRNPNYILGFNEPERTDQANMTVAQAISSWTTISNATKAYNSSNGTSIKLVSPAVADTGGATGGQQWLAQFMSQAAANNLQVDAVAFHWYGVSNPSDPAGAASSFLSRVQSYYNSYQKPVFITEFAIHDWGGAYTDAQITEANRQFLNIVIPQLESRPYVAGYAWYHWFGDARLYSGSGSNLSPTNMAWPYVGAVSAGTTTNISGQSFGEHVANLAGGALSVTTAAPTLKFINALAGESSLTGTLDWSLAGPTNWVRVQPGATLTKAGTNTLTISGGSLTNNGTLDIAQGALNLASAVSGPGTVRVRAAATLTLSSAASLSTTPLIDVRPGGTLSATTLARGQLIITSARTLHNDGHTLANVVAEPGSTISGAGTFTGSLSAGSNSTLRIGTGPAGTPSRTLIDHFDSSSPGPLPAPWTPHASTTEAAIVSVTGNNALAIGSAATPFVGASRTLPEAATLDNASTATYFFRVNSLTDAPNHSFGLSDFANTGTVDFNDFKTQLRLKQGTTANTFAIDARNAGAFTSTLASNLSLSTWYNVWMVVNQSTDRYDLYLNTGTAPATISNRIASQLSFRNTTTQNLDTFLAYAGAAPAASAVRLDSLTFQAGTDLSNPSATFDPNSTWTPQTLTIAGPFIQSPGATLELDVASPSSHDTLTITGPATLAGTLALSHPATSANPPYLTRFPILTATTITGAFSTLTGHQLDPLHTYVPLYTPTTIDLLLTLPGDANLNGAIDPDDYTLLDRSFAHAPTNPQWSDGDFNLDGAVTITDYLLLDTAFLLSQAQGFSPGSFLAMRQSQFGAAYVSHLTNALPEPTLLAACGLAVLPLTRRTRLP